MRPANRVDLSGRRALVIGASGDIGSAIARRLAELGMQIIGVGRQPERLQRLLDSLPEEPRPEAIACDFESTASMINASERLGALPDADVVVLAAGALIAGNPREAGTTDLVRQLTINLTSPWELLRASLPGIERREGQIVVVSSSAALRPNPQAAYYSASHAALRSLSESLRIQVNPLRVRVLTVYPGRTATNLWLQQPNHDPSTYHPHLLLQPQDIAESVGAALQLPRTAELTEIQIRPFAKSY